MQQNQYNQLKNQISSQARDLAYTPLRESFESTLGTMSQDLGRRGMELDQNQLRDRQLEREGNIQNRISADLGMDLLSQAFAANEAARRRQFSGEQSQLGREFSGEQAGLERAFAGQEAGLGREFSRGQIGRRLQDIQGQQERSRQQREDINRLGLFREGAISQLDAGSRNRMLGGADLNTAAYADRLRRAQEMGISPQMLRQADASVSGEQARQIRQTPEEFVMNPYRDQILQEYIARVAAGLDEPPAPQQTSRWSGQFGSGPISEAMSRSMGGYG
tara:strand:+ start:284 stop:1114 length:831 start_codon:yes stop_codon:yes gene_type:complete